MALQGINVNGALYLIDFDTLDNKPANVLPAVTSNDSGKVLSVNASGEWEAGTPATGLPTVTSTDAGKFLRVNSSGEWAAVTISAAENGSF